MDNPAGRLHALLREVKSHESNDATVRVAWATALGVPGDQVTVAMAGVAGLLDDLARLVSRLNDPGADGLLSHFGPMWADALFTPGLHMDQPSRGIVDPSALAALGGLAALLSSTASEGAVPDEEDTAALRDALQETLQEVLNDRATPLEVRTILVARLHDMLWALDHLATTGPEGVKAAAERLAGAFAIRPGADRQNPLVQMALKVAGRAWALFTFGGKVNNALEGWDGLAGLLPPAP